MYLVCFNIEKKKKRDSDEMVKEFMKNVIFTFSERKQNSSFEEKCISTGKENGTSSPELLFSLCEDRLKQRCLRIKKREREYFPDFNITTGKRFLLTPQA